MLLPILGANHELYFSYKERHYTLHISAGTPELLFYIDDDPTDSRLSYKNKEITTVI